MADGKVSLPYKQFLGYAKGEDGLPKIEVWGSNTRYRRVVWQCNNKYKGNSKCNSPHVTEESVKEKFLEAFNSLLKYREELITNCRLAQDALCDCSGIDTELAELHREIEAITDLARKSIYANAQGIVNEHEWLEMNNGYRERHNKALARIDKLDFMKREKQRKKLMLESFIQNIKSQGNALDDFEESIWMATIQRVVISPAGSMAFQFKDGSEICM